MAAPEPLRLDPPKTWRTLPARTHALNHMQPDGTRDHSELPNAHLAVLVCDRVRARSCVNAVDQMERVIERVVAHAVERVCAHAVERIASHRIRATPHNAGVVWRRRWFVRSFVAESRARALLSRERRARSALGCRSVVARSSRGPSSTSAARRRRRPRFLSWAVASPRARRAVSPSSAHAPLPSYGLVIAISHHRPWAPRASR